MGVCLINPGCMDTVSRPLPPLGLAYLAAVLERRGIPVRVVDMVALSYQSGGDAQAADTVLRELLTRMKPHTIGISVQTPLMPEALHSARLAREVCPEATIFMGGPHVTSLPDLTLWQCPEVDAVIVGEGEAALVDCAEGRPVSEIPGVCYREADTTVSSGPEEIVEDLDLLPMPARHLLDMNIYTSPSESTIPGFCLRGTQLITSRGCLWPHDHRNCGYPSPAGRTGRLHSMRRVLDECQHLADNYQIDALYFADTTFSFAPQRGEAICKGLMDLGLSQRLRWTTHLVPGFVDRALLGLMRKAGCVQVEVRCVSGSRRLLDANAPGITVQECRDAVRACKAAGLRVQAAVVAGLPTETEEEFDATEQLLREVKPDLIEVERFVPWPGTRIFEILWDLKKTSARWANYLIQRTRTNFTDMRTEVFEEKLSHLLADVVGPHNRRRYHLTQLRAAPFRHAASIAGLLLRRPLAALRQVRRYLSAP